MGQVVWRYVLSPSILTPTAVGIRTHGRGSGEVSVFYYFMTFAIAWGLAWGLAYRRYRAPCVRCKALAHSLDQCSRHEAASAASLAVRIAQSDHFSYVVSHDLRQPLRTISSFAQLLQKDLRAHRVDRVEDFVGRIVHAVRRMSGLLDDLLIYTRAGKTGELDELVIVGDIVSEVVEDLGGEIAGTLVELSTPNGLPSVAGSKLFVHQLFLNLLSNSVKFSSPEEPCRISIDYRDQDDFYCFSVSDNGRGVDMGKSGRLFEPFQRLTTVADIPGSGIGLAVCHQAVTAMGGEIWLDSPGEGRGCTFYFTLRKPRSNAQANSTCRG